MHLREHLPYSTIESRKPLRLLDWYKGQS